MGKLKTIPFFSFVFWCQVFFGQENLNQIVPALALENLVSSMPYEKTYLQTDKEVYIANETIWFNLYLLNASTHRNTEKSQLVYVDLLNENDRIIIQKKIHVENRSAKGSMDLIKTLTPGTYTLRAYTLYMQNEVNPVPFEKQIIVLGLNSKNSIALEKPTGINTNASNSAAMPSEFNIQFFPEGGAMIDGIETSIAIKVTDKNGKGISTKGKIIDDKNQFVSFFRSQGFGLGMFKISPSVDKKYFAVLGDNLKHQLPETQSEGYVLNAKNKDSLILIDIATNIPKGLEGTYILGHLRGQIIYKQNTLAKRGANSYRIRFLTDHLPDGIVQFTLFKKDGEPVCERLVFIKQKDNELAIEIDTERNTYDLREQVSIKLKLTDIKGNKIDGTMSMAVSAIDRLNLTNRNHTIKNWLSLNSDIGAAIANPGFFFEENSFGRSYLLDILMMTNGWRSFNWKEILYENLNGAKHIPEKGIMVKGSIVDYKTEKRPVAAKVTLNLLGLKDGVYSEEEFTDTLGQFSFGPYVFPDTLKVVINATSLEKRNNGKSKNLTILLQDSPFTKNKFPKNIRKNTFMLQDVDNSINTQLAKLSKNIDFQTDSGTIKLDEAVVTEKKKTRQDSIDVAFQKLNTLYKTPSRRLFIDSIPGARGLPVFDIFRRLPSARVYGNYPDQTLLIRQGFKGNPLFILDGIIVDAQMISGMNTAEIEFVDVLYPAAAGIYANMGRSGVVAIYTKGSLSLPQKRDTLKVPNIRGIKISGLSSTKNFYAPNYSKSAIKSDKPDNRSTLHWQPDIKISSSEKQNDLNISFYTGDVPGPYLIKLEGITTNGIPISGAKVIEVKQK